MRHPKIVGEPEEIVPMRWSKALISCTFDVPGEKGGVVFNLFHSPIICQVVMAVTEQKKVVTIRQFKYGIAAFKPKHHKSALIREFPAGGAEKKENLGKAAKRELLEETGFTCKNLIRLSDGLWNDPACSTQYSVPWLALDCKKDRVQSLDHHEIITVKLVDINEWYETICSGKITDCRTIAVSMLALPHLKSEGLLS